MSQLIACPECQKHLQVPDNLLGKKVQCPECKHTFVAAAPDAGEVAVKTTPSTAPSAPPKPPAWDKKTRDDDDDDDYEPKKKRRGERDDDDDDYDDSPRRSRRRSPRGNYVPHRGGMILAFGIIGLLVFPIFGVIAWVMGNGDLREIREGRMDPEGESMTNAGRILGMVATILTVVAILSTCGLFGCLFFVGAMGAANANKGGFGRRRP